MVWTKWLWTTLNVREVCHHSEGLRIHKNVLHSFSSFCLATVAPSLPLRALWTKPTCAGTGNDRSETEPFLGRPIFASFAASFSVLVPRQVWLHSAESREWAQQIGIVWRSTLGDLNGLFWELRQQSRQNQIHQNRIVETGILQSRLLPFCGGT